MDNETPVVISFYTRNTPYEQEAKQLLASCQQLGIECHIEGINSHGSWEQNCAFKPAFILHKIRQLKRPVIWVDADARFKSAPDWKKFLDHDLALRLNPHFHKEHPSYLMTGTIFVNHTPAALHLLAEWQSSCEHQLANSNPGSVSSWDQTVLARIIDKYPAIRIAKLPLSYIKTTSWDEGMLCGEEPIIEHAQASRCIKPLTTLTQEFQEKKEMWNLGGILDYEPSMFRMVGDSCHSLLPFIRYFVVVMDKAATRTEAELQQFAFLARIFSYGQFVTVNSACSLETRLAIATIFMPQQIDRCLALAADHVVNLDKMTNFLIRQGISSRIKKNITTSLPAFFSKTSPENMVLFTPYRDENGSLFAPWDEKISSVNFHLHPHFDSPAIGIPPNLISFDDNQLNQVQVARHLGIPCF